MMWPHVRFLFLYCNFPYLEYETDTYYDPPEGYDDVYAPLTANLCRMPKLQNITVCHALRDGIPWEAIHAVVQVPQLRHLHIDGHLDGRNILPHETERSLRFPVNSLATIDYPSDGFRGVSATEIKMFSVLLRQANTRRLLETLTIPSECAPLDCLSAEEFPCLRKLSLIGRRNVLISPTHTQQFVPYISILANMPRLRTLALTLAQPINLPRQAIWPAGMGASFPCPDLEELVVSYPHPDDEFYAHLPPTLRHLSLRCWPRHYLHLLEHDRKVMTDSFGWYSPILSSSEMLRILRRCPAHNVCQLEIDFEDDGSGGDLFRCIPDVFPRLQQLVVHRYRRAGATPASVTTLAQALAPLRDLRVLLCHLDFEDAPHPFATDTDFSQLPPSLRRAADVLASSLAPSVEVVGILERLDLANQYLCFRVTRDDQGVARIKQDQFVLERHGLSTQDMLGLSRPDWF
ncbi:hypothetical protein GSI_11453 [Ganoderma sinense ZZ0214-1]|uniref:F-box domain-containing protein n=1 Tax=Ganoderma sinense ZZ0214-1 TaxID=1077348 RepID=A0A2G8RW19_9APHY|nr:hypothetical protein GSI_11453 [Ganoderma sinense ZZ0214-1]